MQPHEQRVVTELTEIVVKKKALRRFIECSLFVKLPEVEKGLLNDQYDAMQAYTEILEKRIARF